MKTHSVEQLVHGYSKGHAFLAGSCRLPKQAQEIVTEQSDLSGPLPAGISIPSYLTAYPLAETEYFALGRTWSDSNAPRSGCVVTHTLLIPKVVWGSAESPHSFLQLHKRPDSSSLETFGHKLELPQTNHVDVEMDIITPEDSQQFVSKIFSEGLRSVVWFDCENADSLLMAFVRLLWPALRSELYANTFSLGSNARVDCELQLHFAPRNAQSSFSRVPKQCYMMKGVESIVRDSDQEWIIQLSQDLKSGTASSKYSHDLRRFGHLLGNDPTAIRSLFVLRELTGRLAHTPMAAIGILDIIDSLEPEGERGLREKQQAFDTAISVASSAETMTALHCLSLVDTRLRRPSFSSVGEERTAALSAAVEQLVSSEPDTLFASCGNGTPLEESYFWIGVRSGIVNASAKNPMSLGSLGRCPEIASFVVRSAPDVARAYLRATDHDRDSGILRLVEWIHRIENERQRSELRRQLLVEAYDDAAIPLLEELLRDLQMEEVNQTLETLAETTQGFTKASIRRVVSDFVCDRFREESIRWGLDTSFLPTRYVPELVATAFPISLEGVDQILRLEWMLPGRKCEVWSAFVERVSKKQLPQWFVRRAADDPALIEPFIGNVPLSARASRALEAIGNQCDHIPVAKSDFAYDFVQTVDETPYSDLFIGKTVDSAISEHMAGSLTNSKFTELLRLPACVQWCQKAPVDRVQSLLLSHADRNSWQRAWSTLSILPHALFQRVAGLQLISSFIRSYRAEWSSDVAEKWAMVLERGREELNYEESLKLLIESTSFCIRNPRLPIGTVVSSAFPPVYTAVVGSIATPITDEMFGYFDWDKAKKLRKDIVDAYMSSCWPPEELALIGAKCQLLRKFFSRLYRKRGGDKYLARMLEGLEVLGTSEAISVLSELSSIIHDPEFFEPWD